MTPPRPRTFVMLVCILTAACARPTDLQTVSTLSIQGNGTILLGESNPYTLMATASDGAQIDATAEAFWAIGNAPVATMAGARAFGQLSGFGTLAAYYRHRTLEVTVRVIPRYQGSWSGTYTVLTCVQTGQFALVNGCGNTFRVGAVLPVSFGFAQTTTTATGQLALGSILSDFFTVPIEDNGQLTFSTHAVSGPLIFNQGWALNVFTAGTMAGNLAVQVRDPTLSGDATFTARLNSTVRTGNDARLAGGSAATTAAGALAAVAGR